MALGGLPAGINVKVVAGERPAMSISEPMTAGPPSRSPLKSANNSRFQRAHTEATKRPNPACSSRRAMLRGMMRARPSSLCRLWLTSCSTAPSVHGFTNRW